MYFDNFSVKSVESNVSFQNRHQNSLHFVPFKCDSCGKEFSNEVEFINHDQDHRNFQCEICAKKFTTKWSLKVHMKTIHEGAKDHECAICGKKFSRKSSLKRHVSSVHQNKKDFNCDQCDKGFSRKINLMNHKINEHQIHLVCKECYDNYVNSNYDVNQFPVEIIHSGEICICQNFEIQN